VPDITDVLLKFIAENRAMFDAAEAVSAIVNILGWTLGGFLIWRAWRRNGIRSVNVGPLRFQLQEEAMTAAATAARDWQAKTGDGGVDMGRLRATVERAFDPQMTEHLIGRSILWVDDNPANNELAMRALRKLMLDVVQVTSTEAALAAMQTRTFDLVISDMGRGSNMRAGYDLLGALRGAGNSIPFFIFSSDDRPEFRFEAKRAGAQLSTNDMLELIDCTVSTLARRAA
jgi:CheY-like chemotaxis protein